jgi:hypothetical protein
MIRWALGFALLPIVAGGIAALVETLGALLPDAEVWAGATVGAACWWVCFALLPKPLWIYVAGHELTHALAALLCGVRLRSIRVRSTGGRVELERTNTFITLAPYIIPLYALAWCGLVLVLLLFSVRVPVFWVSFGLGIAYAFHVTLTVFILRQKQPDFVSEGYFFSGVLTAAANIGFLLIAAGCLGYGLSVRHELTSWARHTLAVVIWVWRNLPGR